MNEREVEPNKSRAPQGRWHDLIIVGGGPAGLTAAVYASLLRMRAFLITTDIGGQTLESSKIENYMGHEFITGVELIGKFQDQLLQHHYLAHRIVEVTSIEHAGEGFAVSTQEGARYEATSLLIATGMRRRHLGVPGEERFQRRGVFYQHVEEGALVAGSEVAVVGGGNSALQAASKLSLLCPRVHVISLGDWTADTAVKEEVAALPNVIPLKNYSVQEIYGDHRATGLRVKCRESSEDRELEVSGVFIEIGWAPNTALLSSLVSLNQRGEIQIRPDCSTSCPGIFAAGDVTDAFGKRVIIAAGEGAKAALSAYEYLLRAESKKTAR